MTTFRKLVTSLALAGMTFAPAIAGAQTVSANTDTSATVVIEAPAGASVITPEQKKEWEAKKKELMEEIDKAHAAFTKKFELLKKLGALEGTSDEAKNGAKEEKKGKKHGEDRSELKGEGRSIVAKAQLVINTYRKSAQQADTQYKKSVGEARNKLMHALKEAVKAKDKDAGYRAIEAYFKSEDEAEAKRDATRIEARTKLMLELKAIFG